MTDGDQSDSDEPEIGAEPEAGPAANPKQNRKKKVAKKLAEREAAQFWREVFASELGRREMWAILAACHTFEQIFATGPNGFPQGEATWFHAGEREVGQRLYRTWLARDPQAIALMHAENDDKFKEFRALEGDVT